MKPHTRRALLVAVLLVAGVGLVSLDAVFDRIAQIIASLDDIIAAHEVGGAVLFVVLSALSAMLAFFSTAVVVPVAVTAWGKLLTILLLWGGWLLGGCASYSIGRFFGRRVVRWFISEEKLRPYAEWFTGNVRFLHVLLFQFALPSEIPGYVLGLAAYRFRTYLAALMIVEMPFAIGAVYLGESFLQRNIVLMIALGIGGVLLTLIAAYLFRSVGKFRAPLS